MPQNAGPQKYSPDALASGGATQRPFQEAGTPKSSTGIVTTLLRLAMRRLTAHGYGATKSTQAIDPGNAMSIGSHGSARMGGSFTNPATLR